jgi:hypothetical protein
MGIKEIIQRWAHRESANYEGISPDEVELNSYLRAERRRMIKERLAYYRNKEAKEIWGSSTFTKGDGSIIRAKNIFNDKHHMSNGRKNEPIKKSNHR